jgi:hypothetical protein
MKVVRAGFLVAAVATSALVLFTPPTIAQPTPCPDGSMPFPAELVPSGDKKDKNDNGLVCAKVVEEPHGGPDDNSVVDDFIL